MRSMELFVHPRCLREMTKAIDSVVYLLDTRTIQACVLTRQREKIDKNYLQ